MSGLAARILESRTRNESVGPRSFLLPSSLLGATFIAVAATTPAPTRMIENDLPPEAHVPATLDVPPPPPLAALRGAEDDIAALAAALEQPSPLPLAPLYKKNRQPRSSAKKTEPLVRVKKMTEPIVRMKNTNGNGNHRQNGQALVHVTVKKRVPPLDAPEKALAWFQGLVKKVNVSAVPTMLDYYRRLGWIPNEAYGWLVELAIGLTKSAQPATWRMVKNDPAELATIHRESYKHLKGLFGERMNRSV